MGWGPETESELRRLWDEGRTASQIARAIGVTRNAVIGKARRLGLDPRPSPIVWSPKPQPARGAGTFPVCQWIEAEPTCDDTCKCRRPTVAGSPYCAEHEEKRRGYAAEGLGFFDRDTMVPLKPAPKPIGPLPGKEFREPPPFRKKRTHP